MSTSQWVKHFNIMDKSIAHGTGITIADEQGEVRIEGRKCCELLHSMMNLNLGKTSGAMCWIFDVLSTSFNNIFLFVVVSLDVIQHNLGFKNPRIGFSSNNLTTWQFSSSGEDNLVADSVQCAGVSVAICSTESAFQNEVPPCPKYIIYWVSVIKSIPPAGCQRRREAASPRCRCECSWHSKKNWAGRWWPNGGSLVL